MPFHPSHACLILNATMRLFRGMIARTLLRDDRPACEAPGEFWTTLVRHHHPFTPRLLPA